MITQGVKMQMSFDTKNKLNTNRNKRLDEI